MGGWNKNKEYEQYIHSGAWRAKANKRLEQDQFKCCVCGGPAEEVHHLTYENFRNEKMEDIVSLCHTCHLKAEEIYDPTVIPWAMDEVKPEGNNFMAAMRTDACKLAPMVFEFIKEVRGGDFKSLMGLRQPDREGRRHWHILKSAVNALCAKRYYKSCSSDNKAIMVDGLANRITVVCLAEIEHIVRNEVQGALHDLLYAEYQRLGKWVNVAATLGLSKGTLRRMRNDDGTSFGPSLREEVLFYCMQDAAAGIRPIPDFTCLTENDYRVLNSTADYIQSVSGNGAFKGGK